MHPNEQSAVSIVMYNSLLARFVDAEFPDHSGAVEHDGHFARALVVEQGQVTAGGRRFQLVLVDPHFIARVETDHGGAAQGRVEI